MIARLVVGSISKGFKTVDLTSKGGERLVGFPPSVVGAGTGVASDIDVVFLLVSMAA